MNKIDSTNEKNTFLLFLVKIKEKMINIFHQKNFHFFLALGLKIGFALFYGFIYAQYLGGGDTWHCQKVSHIIYENFKDSSAAFFDFLFSQNPKKYALLNFTFGNSNARAIFFYKLASIPYFFTKSYYATAIIFSLYSFSGLYYFLKKWTKVFPRLYWAIYFSFFIFPSVLFWSSGLNKEAIMTGAMGFIFGVFGEIYFLKKTNLISMLILGFNFWLLFEIKPFVVLFMLPFIFFLLLWRFFTHKIPDLDCSSNAKIFALSFSFFLIGIFIYWWFIQFFDVNKIIFNLYKNYWLMKIISKEENLIITKLQPHFLSYFQNYMAAFEGVFLRPYFWEKGNFFKLISAFENLLFWALVITAKYKNFLSINDENRTLIIFVIVFCYSFAIILAFLTPNIGTLLRYKIIYLPWLLILLLAGRNSKES